MVNNLYYFPISFEENDFVEERTDSDLSRKIDHGNLKRRLLKFNAVPQIFPGLPSFISRKNPPQRSTLTSSANRHRAGFVRQEQQSKAFLQEDCMQSFESLLQRDLVFPSSWNVFTQKS